MSWIRKENASNCDWAFIRINNCLKEKSEYYFFFFKKKIVSDNRI